MNTNDLKFKWIKDAVSQSHSTDHLCAYEINGQVLQSHSTDHLCAYLASKDLTFRRLFVRICGFDRVLTRAPQTSQADSTHPADD